MKKIDAIKQQYLLTDETQTRFEQIIEQTQQAIKDDDNELIEAMFAWIIGDESSSNHQFPARLQIHFFLMSIDYTIDKLQQTEVESDELHFSRLMFMHLWALKWIIAKLPMDLSFSLEEMSDFNRMMHGYYEQGDLSQSAVHKTIMLQHMLLGDIANAKHHFEQWQTIKADDFSDCPVCERGELVNYHYFVGAYQKAVELAEPILDGSMRSCDVPFITYFPTISSLIEVGDWQRAEHTLAVAIKDIETVANRYYQELPLIIQLTARLGQHEETQRLADKYEKRILLRGEYDNLILLNYFLGMSPISAHYHETASLLVADFDARNQNHYYRNQLDACLRGRTH